jgi:hypothetical protein
MVTEIQNNPGGSSDNSSMVAIVAIVVIVLIALVFYFGFYHRGSTAVSGTTNPAAALNSGTSGGSPAPSPSPTGY